MRVLILTVATFAAGLLAGSVVWPDRDPPPRRTSLATIGADTATVRPGAGPAGAADGVVNGGLPPPAAGSASGNADVRTLAGEARVEIERLMGSDRAEAIRAGEGTISGTVRDPAGEPVEGVMVTLVPETQPFDLALAARRDRERPHADRDLSAVASQAIQRELWRREARTVARTDAKGRFEITGLMDAGHTLTAYHDDYNVKPISQQGRVTPDAVVEFLAQPVAKTRVEVRLPDGDIAENAWLSWKGEHGNGWDAWSREAGKVRLPVGAIRIKAQVWIPEPMQSAEVEHTVARDAPDAVLVLALEERRVLTARLAMPGEFVAPGNVVYRIVRLLGGGDVDPESLLQDKSQPQGNSRAAGKAQWFDLEPGSYLVAAFLNKRRLIADAVVEVGSGATEVELEVREPSAPDTLRVRVLGPDGGPVPGDATFRLLTGQKGKLRSQDTDALRRADGIWLVLLEGVDARGSDEATLRVASREYGAVLRPFRMSSAGTITVRLGKPARLSLRIDGYLGSGQEGKLYVALLHGPGAAAWQKVSANGSCDITAVQPGEYGLQLMIRDKGATWPVYHQRIRLDSGEEERSLRMPALHTLRVRVTGRVRSGKVRLQSDDSSVGRYRREVRHSNRVATFVGLAAGSYEVACGKKRATVRVPGPAEVVLE